ncbi:MAG: MBOAT family protein [Chthoniobacterales bacterium]
MNVSNTLLFIIFLIFILGVGYFIARIGNTYIRRSLTWGILLAGLICVNFGFLYHENNAVLRMVLICLTLLASMKIVVYAEWTQGQKRLTLFCYSIFVALWFGMDPQSFERRKKDLAWHQDFLTGCGFFLSGLFLSYIVYKSEWQNIWVIFIPMSLAFHFGILRILKSFIRRVGFPVRTLFPNPFLLRGFDDFWSRRWNVAYSQMMQRVIGRPAANCFGKNVSIFLVFLSSGLLHELAITLPVKSGYGLPTLYFSIHGLLTVLERQFCLQGAYLKWLAGGCVVAGLPWLFPPAFQREVLIPILNSFSCFLNL